MVEQTNIHTIDVEPDWYLVYVDGELYDEGHPYQKQDSLSSAVNEADGPCEMTDEHINPDPWSGSPQTIEEAKEMYDADGPE